MENALVIDIVGDLSLAYVDLANEQIDELCKEIDSCLGSVDYRMANLESPVVLKMTTKPIVKSGPNLKFDYKKRGFIERININGYVLANNHIGDYGEEGIENTICFLDDIKKEYVGSSLKVQDTYKSLRKTIKGINVSFIAFCENEFGIVQKDRIGAAGYNEDIAEKLIKEEKQWADYVFVIFHGGSEFYPFPLPGQKRRFHHFIDWGADYVVSMHSHCPVGYEEYSHGKIYYGIGNFFFPQKVSTIYEAWNYGYVVRVYLKKDTSEVELIPYCFDKCGTNFSLIEKKQFNSYLELISESISDDAKLEILCENWAEMKKMSYVSTLECGLQNIDKKGNLASLKNIFMCETHNELAGCLFSKLFETGERKNTEVINEIKRFMRIRDFVEENNRSLQKMHKNVIAIWGVGIRAEKMYESIDKTDAEIVFVDTNPVKQGLRFCERKIISPDEIIALRKDTVFYICTLPKWHEEIKQSLIEQGMEAENIFFYNL